MAKTLRFRARTRRAGNSIAIFIPAEEAKRVGIGPDREVDVEVNMQVQSPLGLLRRLGLTQEQSDEIRRDWQKDKKVMWPDE